MKTGTRLGSYEVVEPLGAGGMGDVRVLDFGLAKPLRRPGEDSGSESELPTATSEPTRTGAVIGTAPYMSPEQALDDELEGGHSPSPDGDTGPGAPGSAADAASGPTVASGESPGRPPGGRAWPGPERGPVRLALVILNPEHAAFVHGIHDGVLTELSRIAELTVISRTSVMQYADTVEDIPAIAEELGVSSILEGTVQQVGDRVRVAVRLVDGRRDARRAPWTTLASASSSRSWTGAGACRDEAGGATGQNASVSRAAPVMRWTSGR